MDYKGDGQVRNYDLVLDAEFGAPGTPERKRFEAEAEAYYSGIALRELRKEAGMTQEQVARKIGAGKSYISRVEHGLIVPTVTTFFKIIDALGMRVEITRPVAAF